MPNFVPGPMSSPSVLLFAVTLALCGVCVLSHGSMVEPAPRNAVDKNDPYWAGPGPASAAWSHHVDTPICPVSASVGGLEGNLSLRQGQSCFWFSHGCTIFCDKCDGKTGRLPFNGTCGNAGKVKATICKREHRTINRDAPCNTPADYYYYNPWRAPGSAPVFDACGMAGGSPVPVSNAAVGVRFMNTSHASQGDKGSVVLPPVAPSATVWTAGALAEVSWTVRTNHGGYVRASAHSRCLICSFCIVIVLALKHMNRPLLTLFALLG